MDLVTPEKDAGLGLRHDCTRCGTRHLLACCHASRHNLCDACVHEQHAARAARLNRPIPPGAGRDPLECPPDGGCGGCGNWPEHCVCPISSAMSREQALERLTAYNAADDGQDAELDARAEPWRVFPPGSGDTEGSPS